MRLLKRYKVSIITIVSLLAVALLVNSCKKNDKSDSVSYFLTAGNWKLASVQTQSFVGDTLKRTDTLNTNCQVTGGQVFTFKSDNSCTFTNYHCIIQNSTGSWQLTPDNLNIETNLTAKDTLGKNIVTVGAFATAQIINLGNYSLVLQTGYTSSYYTSKTARKITRYAFVHTLGN